MLGSSFAGPFPRPSWTPLALTLGLHLLLVLAWLGSGPPRFEREAPARASSFVLVQPPASRPQPAASAAARGPASRPRSRLPQPVPLQAPARVRSTISPPSEPPGAAPQPETVAETPTPAVPGDLLATSKRMAGAADRELRNGSSPITAEPDRKWERFASAFAAARKSASRDTMLESHTAADGVTIYRKTVGERVRCYRSGSVGGLGPADGQSAGNVPCPSGVSWARH